MDGRAGRGAAVRLAARPSRRDHAVRYHTTSGTTGRTPLRVLDGTKDWEWIAEMWAYGLWGFGLRPTDVVLFAFSYGTFIGFWGAHYACEKIGCLVLSTGSATTESRVQEHHRHGRDGGVLDADLRAAAVAGGGRDGHRPRPRQQGRTR